DLAGTEHGADFIGGVGPLRPAADHDAEWLAATARESTEEGTTGLRWGGGTAWCFLAHVALVDDDVDISRAAFLLSRFAGGFLAGFLDRFVQRPRRLVHVVAVGAVGVEDDLAAFLTEQSIKGDAIAWRFAQTSVLGGHVARRPAGFLNQTARIATDH